MSIRNQWPALCSAATIVLLLASTAAYGVTRGVRGTTQASVNRGSVNVSRDANVNRDAAASRNVDGHRDVNAGVDPGYGVGDVEHPVAAAVAVASAAAIAGAAIGTVTVELPSACVETEVNGVAYLDCNGTWYQPQFDGYQIEYVVVPRPD